MKRVVLSLGTNMLDREKNLLDCVSLLHRHVGTVKRLSKVHETDSWGFDASPFLNQVVIMDTELPPMDLLTETQAIEKALGRMEKTQKDCDGNPIYQDRIIDIDILLYGDQQMENDRLVVPHPLLSQRAFVLEPLVELFGDQIVAPFNESFQTMLKKIQ